MKQSQERHKLSKIGLFDLIRLIVEERDAGALTELLSHRKPFILNGLRLYLVDFLNEVRKTALTKGLGTAIVDGAYDLTLDKFGALGVSTDAERSAGTGGLKHRGVDCRNYYHAVLDQVSRWRMVNQGGSRIDEELETSSVIHRMVVKHFYLSLKECRRSKMPFTKRYTWIVNGQTIALRRPVEIPAGEFKKWLDVNILDLNPSLPTERNRIQVLIDRHFSHGSFVPWDEQAASQVSVSINPSETTSGKRDSVNSSALANTVAHEKAERIDSMRPAIRELGKDKLYLLVMRIFEDIESGIMEDTRIANDFGLTKATYSRFAGSDWSKNIDEEKVFVPDLWLNLAEVLSTNSDFTGVALSAGIIPKLKKVLMSRRVNNA